MMLTILPARLPNLRAAYDAYRAAEFGQFNATADALKDAASQCGWNPSHELGPVQWTRHVLEQRDKL